MTWKRPSGSPTIWRRSRYRVTHVTQKTGTPKGVFFCDLYHIAAMNYKTKRGPHHMGHACEGSKVGNGTLGVPLYALV